MRIDVAGEIKNGEYPVGLKPAVAHALVAAMAVNAGLCRGLQLHAGHVTHRDLAMDVSCHHLPAAEALA